MVAAIKFLPSGQKQVSLPARSITLDARKTRADSSSVGNEQRDALVDAMQSLAVKGHNVYTAAHERLRSLRDSSVLSSVGAALQLRVEDYIGAVAGERRQFKEAFEELQVKLASPLLRDVDQKKRESPTSSGDDNEHVALLMEIENRITGYVKCVVDTFLSLNDGCSESSVGQLNLRLCFADYGTRSWRRLSIGRSE